MYEVVKSFMDLGDDKHIYKVGEPWPRDGYTPTKDRIDRYLSDKNNLKTPLIKKVAKEKVK